MNFSESSPRYLRPAPSARAEQRSVGSIYQALHADGLVKPDRRPPGQGLGTGLRRRRFDVAPDEQLDRTHDLPETDARLLKTIYRMLEALADFPDACEAVRRSVALPRSVRL